MSDADPAPAGRSDLPRVSSRIALAEVVDRVVARMPAVALTDGGSGRWQTVDRDRRIRGVTVIAQPGGRFELGLHIVVRWPPDPLTQLADDLRRRVAAAAKRESLDVALGEIHIDIVSVEDPDEAEEAQS